MNLLEGLASLDEAEGPTDDEIRAEMAAQGIDMDAWAAEIQAKAEAQLRAEEARRQERARRKRRNALVGGGIGLAIAAGTVGVVLHGGVPRGSAEDASVADKPKPSHSRRSRELPRLGSEPSPLPSASATAEVPDAGSAGPSGKR